MDTQALGRALIAVGIVIAIVGVAIYFGGKTGFFGLGKLPGDVRIERENMRVYFPITTSILISVVLTLILLLLSRLR